MDLIRRIAALENKVAHLERREAYLSHHSNTRQEMKLQARVEALEGRHEPKVVHMRPRAPVETWVIPSRDDKRAPAYAETLSDDGMLRVVRRTVAPIWADFSATIPIERIEDAARSVMVPRDAEDDMA